MALVNIIPLVPVPPSLATCYGPGVKPRDSSGGLWRYDKLVTAGAMAVKNPEAWKCTPGHARDLLRLDEAMKRAGSRGIRLTEVRRPWAVQAAERAKLERWWAAGKPRPGQRGWNAETMRTTYVARAGGGNHTWGGADDIDLDGLDFPGVARDHQLQAFWEISAPLGFTPIIAHPNAGQSEAWHFDHLGPLQNVYDLFKEAGPGYYDAYAQTALVGCVLTGSFEGDRKMERMVQARLLLAGFWTGPCDGQIGPTTMKGFAEAEIGGVLRTTSPVTLLNKLDEAGVALDLIAEA